MDPKIKEKLDRIREQEHIIEKATEKLKQLLGMASDNNIPTDTSKLPTGFSLMNEMMKIFREGNQDRMSALELRSILTEKFGTNFDVRNIRSTLNYLASPKKDLLRKEAEKGVFSLKQLE